MSRDHPYCLVCSLFPGTVLAHGFSSPLRECPGSAWGTARAKDCSQKAVQMKTSSIFKTQRFSYTGILHGTSVPLVTRMGLGTILLYLIFMFIYLHTYTSPKMCLLLTVSCQLTLVLSSSPFMPPVGTQQKHSALCHRNPILMVLTQHSHVVSHTFT